MASNSVGSTSSAPAVPLDGWNQSSSHGHPDSSAAAANAQTRSSNPFLDDLSGIQKPSTHRSGSFSRRAITMGKEKASDDPPRYDEIYKDDGKFQMPDGKSKLLTTPAARSAFFKKNKINDRFLHLEETELVYDKKPVVIIDTSGSMGAKVKKGATGRMDKLKNKLTPSETRLKEQKKEGIELLQMLEAFCQHAPSLYTLNGTHIENASSTSAETKRAYDNLGGATPLASTLQKVKADLSRQTSTHDVALYISTDGDPSEGRDRTSARLAFENELRSLTDNGVTAIGEDGVSRTRQVSISMQYVGDDDDEYRYQTPYDDSSPDAARKSAQARISEVRQYGSAAAYYNALDNERMGGIKRFDVNDDPASEINEASRLGHNISRKEVTLKKMVGMLSARLDQKDEGVPLSS